MFIGILQPVSSLYSGLFRLALAAAITIGMSFMVGCPDYSHLREVPDYENMTDSGMAEEESNAE